MKGLFTKELGGTLLIVTPDDRTYEVSRCNSSILVMPDEGTPNASDEENEEFINLYKHSGCYNV